MKGIVRKLGFLVTVTLISALPVTAETGMGMNGGDNFQKDECLLVAQNCRDSVDSLQQRIDRLHREIGKGTSVYTQEELRKLEFQLKDAIQTMEVLTRGGA
ncbi:hypothetical protein KOM00_15960 [Geomonas sp. Red69]|uniref:Uncharacterized protein n=1 Tax=Geomonas diazotrophica TaxID=2843197 RepID=A0ABX8JH08_9BACT|nr:MULTISPECIES: hypothetical protein [Geomonas]MBU5638223.1 hypothetical protein [Geomonas diazotrophica]QWV96767.1 hypothetical protein KP005_15615 [Geomonas nitrogeniifigens]QXE85868.1 hypothetical protein KP003_16090 [Geomonas nitrogeniifigens]